MCRKFLCARFHYVLYEVVVLVDSCAIFASPRGSSPIIPNINLFSYIFVFFPWTAGTVFSIKSCYLAAESMSVNVFCLFILLILFILFLLFVQQCCVVEELSCRRLLSVLFHFVQVLMRWGRKQEIYEICKANFTLIGILICICLFPGKWGNVLDLVCVKQWCIKRWDACWIYQQVIAILLYSVLMRELIHDYLICI